MSCERPLMLDVERVPGARVVEVILAVDRP